MIEGIKRVTCVGSGLVGQDWASLFALAGYEVALVDLNEKVLVDALERVVAKMRFLEEAGLAKKRRESIEATEYNDEYERSSE